MDSKEDAERGSSGDGACSLIASEFSSDSSEGITPPPPTPAWAFVTDDDATPPPRDIDPEAVHPQASVAPEAADGASVEEGMIITSRISSGLAKNHSVIRQELPTLYVYDHCPFCVRVRLALGVKNVKHLLHFLANDDVATPTGLVGKKIAPFFVS